MDDNSITHYYGSCEKHDDPDYGARILIVIFGFDKAYLDFLSPDDAFLWESEYKDVKTSENFANMYINVYHMLLMEKMDLLFCTEYIPITVAFVQKWGLEMVPADLRFSINDVRTNIIMSLILWPLIHYIHEDGTV